MTHVPRSEGRFDVIVIGGGAAGLFCAGLAGQRGLRVLVVDHANKVGKKILMSGGGRCNFTNLGASPAQYLSANPHFCKSALARYTPQDFVALVERHRIAYHEKELGQLFCDDSSRQIVRLLLDECARGEVRIETHCSVERVAQDEHGFRLDTTLGVMRAPRLVVASGGLSIPSMGASGFGYALAQQFGHRVLPTRAGLVPLTLSGKHLQRLSGLAGVALPVEARCNGTTFRNAMLLTHRGVSGPAILQISSYWNVGDPLSLHLLPDIDDVFAWLRRQRATRGAGELRALLSEHLPKRFVQCLCEHWLGTPRLADMSDDALRQCARTLQAWPLIASGSEGWRTAEVTLGGVDTDELSSATLQSRRVPGLYFIGEVVDVTGWLGGYNFQWAWASAHACAEAL